MRILILNARVRNLGDRAIATCMREQLLAAFPGAELTFDSDEPEVMRAAFPDARVVPAFIDVRAFRFDRSGYSPSYFVRNFAAIARVVCRYAYAFLYAWFRLPWAAAPLLAEYRRADLVVWAGGDYVSSVYGARIAFRLSEILLARAMGKTVAIYAQTIGPFAPWIRPFARVALRRADMVLARDEESVAFLRALGVEKNVTRVTDSVLLLAPDETDRVRAEIARLGLDAPTVGFCVIDQSYSHVPDAAYKAYVDGMAELMRDTLARGWRVLLVTATPEDTARATAVRREHGFAFEIFDAYAWTSGEAKALLSKLRAVVSSRMHPIIFAAEAGVPCFGVNKLGKMKQFLTDAGLGAFHAPMDPFDLAATRAALSDFFDRHDEAVASLSEHLPRLRAMSRASAETIRARVGVAHLVLTTMFLPNGGGKEMSIDRLSRALVSTGEPTEVVCSRYAFQGDTDAFDRTYPVPVFRFRNRLVDATFRGKVRVSRAGAFPFRRVACAATAGLDAVASSLALFFATRRRIGAHRGRIVVLHCHTFGATLAALLCRQLSRGGIRVVYVNGYVHHRSGLRFADAITSRAFRAVDLSLCVSEASRRPLVDEFGAYPNRVVAYGNWIEPDLAVDARTRASGRTYEGPMRILCVGRLERDKGFDAVIALVRRVVALGLEDWYRVTVVGDGDKAIRDELEALARETPVVAYAGWVKKPELWEYYARADVFLLPSRWEEAGGNVALEAYAFGVPVVGTNRGGIPEKIGPFAFHALVDSLEPDAVLPAVDALYAKMRAAGPRAVFDDAQETLKRFSPEARFAVYKRAVDKIV